ncbi:MAG: thioredoxin domain-containing protein [Phormidesmis sp.]
MMTKTVTEDNFNREVLASSVPVFVHFQAPWCGVCRLAAPILASFQADWPGPLRIYDVNADENFKLANRYQLSTLPTLLYIENGKVLHRIEGFDGREGLRARLAEIESRCRLEDSWISLIA